MGRRKSRSAGQRPAGLLVTLEGKPKLFLFHPGGEIYSLKGGFDLGAYSYKLGLNIEMQKLHNRIQDHCNNILDIE